MKKRILLTSFLTVLSLNGCVRIHETHGNFVENEKLTAIHQGSSAKEVMNILGSPTLVAPFNERRWYYIGVKESHIAFLSPKAEQARLLKLEFDPADRLQIIAELDPREQQNITLSPLKTQDVSYERSLLRRVFGNVGRFNNADTVVKPGVGGPQ